MRGNIKYLKEVFKIGFWKFVITFQWEMYKKNALGIRSLGEYHNSIIHRTASFREPQLIYLGKDVYINEGCFLWAGKKGIIKIGSHTLLGPNVMIFSSNHGTSKHELIVKQEWEEKDVIIGEDCWIGASSVILPGVTLGKGTVVASGAIVTHDTPPYSIIAGCPAKVISYRS